MKKILREHRAVVAILSVLVLAFMVWLLLQLRILSIRREKIYSEKTGSIVDATGAIVTTCIADFNNIQYNDVYLNNDLVLKSWVKCELVEPNKRISYVNVPLFIEDSKIFYAGLANGYLKTRSIFSK